MAHCNLCHGHGTVIKRETCPVCHGHRHVRAQCDNCGGQIYIEAIPFEIKCPQCDVFGMKEYPCTHCDTTGGVPVKETCPDCGGRGTLPD